MIVSKPDHEVSLLEVLRLNPDAAQRDMAEALGLSLGMTNLLLKDLAAKGWMLMRHLNARKVQYILTPEGVNELSRRSYRFLKKSIRQVADCRVQLETLVAEARQTGHSGLWLVGTSEVGFVIEWLCDKQSFPFGQGHIEACPFGWFIVHGEEHSDLSPNILDYLGLQAPESYAR